MGTYFLIWTPFFDTFNLYNPKCQPMAWSQKITDTWSQTYPSEAKVSLALESLEQTPDMVFYPPSLEDQLLEGR